MSQPSFEERRADRMIDLMSDFFVYETKARKLAGNGGHFTDVHEWQILAANTINAIREEGLLPLAKAMYSWERETIEDYLKIYDEIQSGVRI